MVLVWDKEPDIDIDAMINMLEDMMRKSTLQYIGSIVGMELPNKCKKDTCTTIPKVINLKGFMNGN